MKQVRSFLLLLIPVMVHAQLPNTDIWSFNCTLYKGVYQITNGSNITSRKGYDNQPCYSENGSYMLYTSQQDSSETDIMRYSMLDHTTERITSTSVSEYSPTYMPGNQFISAVVVEKDSVQRLWRYNKMSGKSSVILPKVYQVGYHCWYSEDKVFLFQVTEPSSLVMTDVRSGSTRTIVSDVGRCMQIYRSPTHKLLLYTQQDTSKNWVIRGIDGSGIKAADFKPVTLPGGAQDFAVDQNGIIITASGTKVYQWKIGVSMEWTLLTDLSAQGLHNITRIAVSPGSNHIAFVDNTDTK